MKFSEYTTKNIEEVLGDLKTTRNGLSEKEAAERQKIFGLNELKVKKTGLFNIFIRQFKSPFFYLLFVAAVIAFLIGEQVNALIIIVFVCINAFLGFFQEAKASKAAAILKKYLPLRARVKREGKEKIVEQKFLVPGDIVILEAGNIIPADLRLLKTENLLIDEGILSGESAPVAKTSKPILKKTKEFFLAENIAFTASSAISGEGEGVVVGTGKETFFGEVAKLTTETVRQSVYEKNMLKFSKLILRLVVISIILVFLANLIVKGTANLFDFSIFCIALVVSIVPEALPVVITFALSQGALKLAKEKMVVKRLSAIEDLGDIEILCADKTGTLTLNKLSLDGIFSPDKEKCLLYGLLLSPFIEREIKPSKNPFDTALFKKAPQKIRELLSQFKEIADLPFDNDRLRNSALLENKTGRRILIARGAPEVILNISSKIEGGEDASRIKEKIKEEGRKGRRTLAVAFKEFGGSDYCPRDEKDLTFLGYFSFLDPLKKTAKSAMRLSEKLGVQIKILTGDAPEVAGAIGKEIGLIKDQNEVILGETIESLDESCFARACENFRIFARLSPKTKFKIVETLQKKYDVGFLGEGINDAPSLKIANVAISVREGADISREVSDIILLKKDLRVIVEGIKRGRCIFSNINKYIKCTLASNFGNCYSLAIISLFIPFLPMLPIQILLVNLLSDFPLIAVATDKVDVEELKKPKLYQLSQIMLFIMFLALVSTIFDFIFFAIFYKKASFLLQTLWFIVSILTEIVLIFSIRTRHLFFKTRAPSIPLLFFSLLTVAVTIFLPFSLLGREFFGFVPPPISALQIILFIVLGYFIVSEIVKLIYFRVWRGNNSSVS